MRHPASFIHGVLPLIVLALPALTLSCNTTSKAQTTMNTLTPQLSSLSTIAALEAKGDIPRLEKALGEGYDNGLTTSQMKEALSQLYAYTGFPRSLNSLGALQRVIQQRKDKGLTVPEGTEASPLPSGYDALRDGTAVQTRLTGVPFDYTFAPATDYYLKAHLFGDIFARDNLTFAQRELVTVSALSSLPGCEPQLRSHIAGARNMGLPDDDIRSIAGNLAKNVGPGEAYRCEKAVAEVFGEPFDVGEAATRYRRGIEDSPYPVGEPNVRYGMYFMGKSYLAPLGELEGGPVNVTFEPGCRNNWHIHHGAVQVLMCVAGRGWYQQWGKEAVELVPGTIITIPAGVKHWHGAAADSWMQHLTYNTSVEEGSTSQWLEPVGEDVYGLLE